MFFSFSNFSKNNSPFVLYLISLLLNEGLKLIKFESITLIWEFNIFFEVLLLWWKFLDEKTLGRCKFKSIFFGIISLWVKKPISIIFFSELKLLFSVSLFFWFIFLSLSYNE